MPASRYLAYIFLLGLTNVYMLQAGQAGQISITEQLESSNYRHKDNTQYKIEPGSVRISIVTPKVLYKRLRKPFVAELERKEAMALCSEQFNIFTCQTIYGATNQKLPAEPPKSLLSLDIPLAFTEISYKAFAQKSDGSKTKPLPDTVNCLNVDIPIGYWEAARKSTQIVSKSNLRLDLKNPANQLKANICKILDANIDYLEKLMR